MNKLKKYSKAIKTRKIVTLVTKNTKIKWKNSIEIFRISLDKAK
jgi:hypothetical protein